ncbi:MAG: endonuclease/exonuclease/phosphatase family protein [Planctomyces sp.]|nr:endonuclease/exonuclease/phosphatase family protein [Planctomyces sp.]
MNIIGPGKFRSRPRLAAVIVLASLLVPYGFSRTASYWRRVSIHTGDVGPTEGRTDETIRVACYNIAHGRGLATSNWDGGTFEERKARLQQIADLLKELDADIVVLNEVDFDSSWSLNINQAQSLATLSGYPYWAEQRNLDFRILAWNWQFGNAILSKHPITHASELDLPGYSTVEACLAGKKKGLSCTIAHDSGELRIIGVHLCHRSEEIRVQSAQVIAEIASSDAIPTIVAGDFNSTPTGFPNSQTGPLGDNAMDVLDASRVFHRLPEQPPESPAELTYHSAQPEKTIDWILIPKNFRFIKYHAEDSPLSDHRPVIAEFSTKPAASDP